MAKLYVTEYEKPATSAGMQIANAGQEPAKAVQAVSFTGTAGQSAAFNAATTFVRLEADANCSVAFGTDPTADANSQRMAAGESRLFGVVGGHKVSAITNT